MTDNEAVCGGCGLPAHRYGTGDYPRKYYPTACINSLRAALESEHAARLEAERNQFDRSMLVKQRDEAVLLAARAQALEAENKELRALAAECALWHHGDPNGA